MERFTDSEGFSNREVKVFKKVFNFAQSQQRLIHQKAQCFLMQAFRAWIDRSQRWGVNGRLIQISEFIIRVADLNATVAWPCFTKTTDSAS